MDSTRHVIVDTDGGIDDALALIHVVRSPSIDLVAVGSVHGNVTTEAAARNSLRSLELAEDNHTPVAVGAAAPLTRELKLRHPEDLFGSAAGAPSREPTPESAVEQLVRLARQRPGQLSLLTLGPMTNIAQALAVEPALPDKIGKVVAMAGVIASPGNITPVAETNVWNDPDAFKVVLTAGFDLTLVGLDVTRLATATSEWLQALAEDQTQLWGQYAAALLSEHGDQLPPLPLHDPLAAAVLIDPTVATLEHRTVAVSTSNDDLRGQLHAARNGDPNAATVEVATAVDHSRFLSSLLDSLVPVGRDS